MGGQGERECEEVWEELLKQLNKVVSWLDNTVAPSIPKHTANCRDLHGPKGMPHLFRSHCEASASHDSIRRSHTTFTLIP